MAGGTIGMVEQTGPTGMWEAGLSVLFYRCVCTVSCKHCLLRLNKPASIVAALIFCM